MTDINSPSNSPPAPATEAAAPPPQQEGPRSKLPSNFIAAVERDFAAQDAAAANQQGEAAAPSKEALADAVNNKNQPTTADSQSAAAREEQEFDKWISERRLVQKERKRVREEVKRANEYRDGHFKHQRFQELLAKDPSAIINEYNIDKNTLVKSWLEKARDEVPKTAEQQVQDLRAELQAKEQAQEEARKKELDSINNKKLNQSIDKYIFVVDQYLNQDPDRWQLTRTYGLQNKVWNFADNEFAKTGKVPTPEQALDAVEKNLREFYKKGASTSYFKTLVQDSQGTQQSARTGASILKPASLTGSNTRSSTPLPKSVDEETEEERSERAKAIFLRAVQK